MQSKNAIKFLAIVFAIICLFELSFTFFTWKIENDAEGYAKSKNIESLAGKLSETRNLDIKWIKDSIEKRYEKKYLDSMETESVYFGYTYNDCKKRELNLGLDLKGGMNVTLEVSVVDVIQALANNTNGQDSSFNAIIANAKQLQTKTQNKDFVDLFYQSFKELYPERNLAVYFANSENKDVITPKSTDKQILAVIKAETDAAINNSYQVLKKRISRFGVSQPNIQKLATNGRILVELPGIKDPERVRNLLQVTAKLEFWETYEFSEVAQKLALANKKVAEIVSLEAITKNEKKDSLNIIKDETVESVKDSTKTKSDKLVFGDDSTGLVINDLPEKQKASGKKTELFTYLMPNVDPSNGQPLTGAVVGRVDIKNIKDTADINKFLAYPEIINLFPRDLKFLWSVNQKQKDDKGFVKGEYLELIAIKVPKDGVAKIDGEAVSKANKDVDQFGRNEISMTMTTEGSKSWETMTGNNVGKCIAIVLDDYVYSCPVVQGKISGGRTSISGVFTMEEADDLANVLKSGKLKAPAKIVEEAIVGPSLGQESINSGIYSFIVALLVVLLYMIFYYNRSGLIADIALIANILFLIGVLASLGAVLTLPGIAGIVLTMGMAVDANVLIFERIREEVRNGKGIRLAIDDGYKKAYSSIIDANVTTLLTGIALFLFGSGPVKGFATTLIIGILTSLFSAIFITRLIFIYMMDKNKVITFDTKYTRNLFSNINIDFGGMRKITYAISGIIIILGLISIFSRGFDKGIDFQGGRSYLVRFDKSVSTSEVKNVLKGVFVNEKGIESRPEVKEFGGSTQVKIITSFMIDSEDEKADQIVEDKLVAGLSKVSGKTPTILSSQKVGPTIADDILLDALYAILISIAGIFIYVLIRFKKWQFSLGASASLIHDALILLSIFSLCYGFLPFSLEIDQAFIAAILTVIGYSINDTVVVFDRIREYISHAKSRPIAIVANEAINSTIGRTLNTSFTTIIVLIIIFIFGGETLRGFMFAMIIGISVGTYSSIFIATPLMLDTYKIGSKKDEEK